MARAPKKGAEAETDAPTLDTFGQITVTLDGAEYVLRPSWQAIEAIEQQLRPISSLAVDAETNRLRVSEMAIIVTECMKAQGRTMADDEDGVLGYRGAKPNRIAEMVYGAGLMGVATRIYVLLYGAVTGGFDASGERKAAGKTMGGAPAAG